MRGVCIIGAVGIHGVELEVLALPKTRKHFVADELTLERINKLSNRLAGKTDTEIIKDSLAHFLGTIERDLPVYVTAPSEVQKSKPADHKRTQHDD